MTKRAREGDGQFKGDDPSTPNVNEAYEPNPHLLRKIGKVCHEMNRTYCESIRDFSQKPWDESPAWQKKSAIEGVRHALTNPKAKPQDSHESWLKAKKAEGWVFGEVKDPAKKTHPCMVPYKDLSVEQQAKDKLFLAIVKILA